jgi:hypothetical protein
VGLSFDGALLGSALARVYDGGGWGDRAGCTAAAK